MIALFMLLLYGGTVGAASVLDGAAAARAGDAGTHIEGTSGAACTSHDEATCELCRVATLNGVTAARAAPAAVQAPDRLAAPRALEMRGTRRSGAPHSRAPPVA
jgi:hypothetical protein